MVEKIGPRQQQRLKTRVTCVGALVNFFLSVIKVGFGISGQSEALIADGIHSLSDLASDAFVLIAVKLGSREADHDHPYGHRRFETLATVLLGGGLVIVGGWISWDAIRRLLHPEMLLVPKIDALVIAAISILSNEWLYQYTKRIARKTRSKLLLANAWHHRSDAISSIVVLFGIMAVLYGYPFADAVAAIIVALMVAKIGLSLLLESVKELVDTSLPTGFVGEIRTAILNTDGVRGIHLLRTRQMGEDAYVDAHIVVNPRISVSEGHMIADEVRDGLIASFDDIMDVLVHIDPEDDEFKEKNKKPMTRNELLGTVERYLGDFSDHILDINIHYLDSLVELEVILPKLFYYRKRDLESIKKKAAILEREVDLINRVKVLIQT